MPRKKRDGPPKKTGPAPIPFTDEMTDRAKRLLGRQVYPSVVVTILCRRYGFGRDLGYRLVHAAREEVIRSIQAAGTADDPLTGVYLFYQQMMANRKAEPQHQLAAAHGIVKLLGLDRILKNMDTLGVEDFLAAVAARSINRPPPPEPAPVNRLPAANGAAH